MLSYRVYDIYTYVLLTIFWTKSCRQSWWGRKSRMKCLGSNIFYTSQLALHSIPTNSSFLLNAHVIQYGTITKYKGHTQNGKTYVPILCMPCCPDFMKSIVFQFYLLQDRHWRRPKHELTKAPKSPRNGANKKKNATEIPKWLLV